MTLAFEHLEAKLLAQLERCKPLRLAYVARRVVDLDHESAGHDLYAAAVELDRLYRELLDRGGKNASRGVFAGIGADFDKPDGELTLKDEEARIDHTELLSLLDMAVQTDEQAALDHYFANVVRRQPFSVQWEWDREHNCEEH